MKKRMSCVDCGKGSYVASSPEEMMKEMMYHYKSDHAEMMAGHTSESFNDWMKRFNESWEKAEELPKKRMSCLDCDELFEADSTQKMLESLLPHYMSKHKEIMDSNTEESKADWMKRFYDLWEKAKVV